MKQRRQVPLVVSIHSTQNTFSATACQGAYVTKQPIVNESQWKLLKWYKRHLNFGVQSACGNSNGRHQTRGGRGRLWLQTNGGIRCMQHSLNHSAHLDFELAQRWKDRSVKPAGCPCEGKEGSQFNHSMKSIHWEEVSRAFTHPVLLLAYNDGTKTPRFQRRGSDGLTHFPT